MAKKATRTRRSKQTSSMSRFLLPDETYDAVGDIEANSASDDDKLETAASEKPDLKVIDGKQQGGKETDHLSDEPAPDVVVTATPSSQINDTGVLPLDGAPIPFSLPIGQHQRERKRDITFTATANAVLEQLISLYAQSTGSAITPTHVVRGILLAAKPELQDIAREIAKLGPMKRPGNESKYADDRETFERTLGEAFLKGVARR